MCTKLNPKVYIWIIPKHKHRKLGMPLLKADLGGKQKLQEEAAAPASIADSGGNLQVNLSS